MKELGVLVLIVLVVVALCTDPELRPAEAKWCSANAWRVAEMEMLSGRRGDDACKGAYAKARSECRKKYGSYACRAYE